MTLQQLRYVVEVAQTGSISQSAINLYTSQPNLSTLINQFEEELGVQLFLRTNRGVVLTEDGREFVAYAQKIVSEADHLEKRYTEKRTNSVSFRVAWTISNEVSELLADHLNELAVSVPVDITLLESSQQEVLNAVIKYQAEVGKILIPEAYMDLYKRYCKTQGLTLHPLWKAKTCLIFSAESKLAAQEVIAPHMLADDFIELIYGPNGLYELPNSTLMRHSDSDLPRRRIFFNDRGNLMDLLTRCPNTFIRAISMPPDSLNRYNLAIRRHIDSTNTIVEAVVYPKRPLSKEAKWFIKALEAMRDPDHPSWPAGFGPEPV